MITRFFEEHFFLSNFYPSNIQYMGENYPTIEHAFQAAKTLNLKEQTSIRDAVTPNDAKKLGRQASLRSDWESIKDSIMLNLLEIKFRPHSQFATKLLATGNEKLIEGNVWNDKYWGAVLINEQWEGQNKLGILLMQIRDKLKGENK